MCAAFTSYNPPLRFLMGAGPSALHPRVLSALSRPIISHMDSEFLRIFHEVQELLREVMQTTSPMTFPMQGPGSAAMEMCIANLVEPGDKVIVMNNGIYGERFFDMATIYGANIVHLEHTWGEELSAERLEEALKTHKDVKIVCCVHGESSTGVMSDVKTLAALSHAHGALILVDIAATLGGVPVFVEEWGLDAVYSNGQKCLSAPPGLSPISLSERAMHKMLHRKTPVASWCFDVRPIYKNIMNPHASRFFSHTSPSHEFYALHEALLMLHEEGMDQVWSRHQTNSQALTAGLKSLNCIDTTPWDKRIPQLNVLWGPSEEYRSYLLKNYFLEISDGMGQWAGKTFRICVMGQMSQAANVLYCISAMGQTLQHFGKDANISEALDVARRYLCDLE